MPEFDLVIKDGMVIDGTRLPRYKADIGVKDGKIAKIGRLQSHQGTKTLDAEGHIVAPGFIDLHTHYDAQLFWDPYLTISGWHGITSVVIGNCGFGFAPVPPEDQERAMLTMTRTEAIPYESMKAGMPWDWVTFPEFLDSVDRTPKGLNILPYVPIAPLMVWVMGREGAKSGRMPTDDEHRKMVQLLHEGMEAGGCGWSAQRFGKDSVQCDYDGTPMPTDIMHQETCLELAKVLADRNEGFIQMSLIPSVAGMEEIEKSYEELAEASGRPILYNAIQAMDSDPERHRGLLRWIERCRQKGLRIYGQLVSTSAGFTFTFHDWNLWDDDPAWREATLGTVEERKSKLADPTRRASLKNDPTGAVTASFDNIIILEVKREDMKHLENLTLREAGEREGKHPVDTMLDLAVADDMATTFYSPAVGEKNEYLKEIVNDSTLLGVSDGGAHTKFFCGGRYSTESITRMVRELNMMSLEEAHWRLSAQPAACGGFKDRGVLREGTPADIVVYDYDNLEVLPMEVVHDLPGKEWRRVQKAKGYRAVLVNGEMTLENDKNTGTIPGKLLRNGV
jgi:N-acyl-D-aspartate/D-glutamate deacylase